MEIKIFFPVKVIRIESQQQHVPDQTIEIKIFGQIMLNGKGPRKNYLQQPSTGFDL